MKYSRLSEGVFVSGQVTKPDLSYLNAQGITTLVCMRPDGEEADQPSYNVIEETASSLGMKSFNMPIQMPHVTREQVDAFKLLLDQLDEPTLVYCASGTRVAIMWGLMRLREASPAEVLNEVQNAGYPIAQELSYMAQLIG